MLEFPNGYGIRNGEYNYEVCIKIKNGKRAGEYKPKWYFTTLHQAVGLCIDRCLVIPKSLELMADEVESLKSAVESALKRS